MSGSEAMSSIGIGMFGRYMSVISTCSLWMATNIALVLAEMSSRGSLAFKFIVELEGLYIMILEAVFLVWIMNSRSLSVWVSLRVNGRSAISVNVGIVVYL